MRKLGQIIAGLSLMIFATQMMSHVAFAKDEDSKQERKSLKRTGSKKSLTGSTRSNDTDHQTGPIDPQNMKCPTCFNKTAKDLPSDKNLGPSGGKDSTATGAQ